MCVLEETKTDKQIPLLLRGICVNHHVYSFIDSSDFHSVVLILILILI